MLVPETMLNLLLTRQYHITLIGRIVEALASLAYLTPFRNGDTFLKQMLESITNKIPDPTPEKPAQPGGIGMAVAFDWGLTTQILVTPLVTLILGGSGGTKSSSTGPTVNPLVSILISYPVAILLAIFGEGVRRGWRWTRPIQIGANTLGFLGGIATLFGVVQGARRGNYWPVATTTILLIFSPLIAWRLSRPETGRWFATVSSAEARKRHGGLWPFFIAGYAIIGGVLQALAVFNR
jgi:hypothetical protein